MVLKNQRLYPNEFPSSCSICIVVYHDIPVGTARVRRCSATWWHGGCVDLTCPTGHSKATFLLENVSPPPQNPLMVLVAAPPAVRCVYVAAHHPELHCEADPPRATVPSRSSRR